MLTSAFNTVKERNGGVKKFEVVYVSSDKDADHMYRYMSAKHGDWAAISYDDPMRYDMQLITA